MKQPLSIYWVRRDFRLNDNPSLTAACNHAKQEHILLLPLFIVEDYMCVNNPKYQFGYPSRVFLSRALPEFSKNFTEFCLVKGKVVQTFTELAKHHPISVFVNEDVHEDFYAQVTKLQQAGITITVLPDMLTVSKETVSGSGGRYSVFTPFKKAVWAQFVAVTPLPKPPLDTVTYPSKDEMAEILTPQKLSVDSLLETFTITRTFTAGGTVYDVDTLIPELPQLDSWYYSEADALKRFSHYLEIDLQTYKEKRDSLELDGTSKMSLALAWGLVSARTLVHMIREHEDYPFAFIEFNSPREGAFHYISELIWREFYKYLYFHNPKLMQQEFQEKFRGTVQWEAPAVAHARFTAWIRGETGYPIVDAAMQQIAQTGWMHNRARMIVASVLTKNLGVDWRWGQEYFRAMLIDLDEASNNGGWQWGASVGADPKPIRIFNPYLQAENYDAHQVYQNKFLPASYRSNPPTPIVEHKDARQDALTRYGLSEPTHGTARDF